ncbi:MAG TPA: ankyrin repeat domain-containing protein [Mucilaginibacter sp.]|nr:ankyrin repeat domain-containing protein [Mucilaginibacter sp.]
MNKIDDLSYPAIRSGFIEAATWHGVADEADELLTKYPILNSGDIFTAAILGDAESVVHYLAENPANATATAEPFGGNALTYLCLSKYLRLKKRPAHGFLEAAEALIDAGADPSSGFWTTGKNPEFETALYGAAGVVQHAGLTQLLVDRGAEVNDEEVCYHSPETWENDAMKVLVDTGRLTEENLTMMLIRKHDFHDYEGAKYLLEHGANPNGARKRGWYPFHHALARINGPNMFELLLDHHADPYLINDGLTAVARAAYEGRADVLEIFRERGFDYQLQGIDELICACALGDEALVQKLVEANPTLKTELINGDGTLLAKFCAGGNQGGAKLLLNLGVPVNAPFTAGDGYYGTPPGSLPIHVAAWHNYPSVVQLLIDNGATVDLPDANGDTPLMLSVRASTQSYWTRRRSPVAVATLLEAGASAVKAPYPCGYDAIDILLEQYR